MKQQPILKFFKPKPCMAIFDKTDHDQQTIERDAKLRELSATMHFKRKEERERRQKELTNNMPSLELKKS